MAERVFRVRESDSSFDETAERVAIEIPESDGGSTDVFKLEEGKDRRGKKKNEAKSERVSERSRRDAKEN